MTDDKYRIHANHGGKQNTDTNRGGMDRDADQGRQRKGGQSSGVGNVNDTDLGDTGETIDTPTSGIMNEDRGEKGGQSSRYDNRDIGEDL